MQLSKLKVKGNNTFNALIKDICSDCNSYPKSEIHTHAHEVRDGYN